MNLMIDPNTNDLVMRNGQMQLVDGGEAELLQKIKSNLMLALGDSYLYPDRGIPYIQEIFQKGTDLGVVRAYFVKALLDTEGVLSVSSLEATYGRQDRSYLLEVELVGTTGPLRISQLEVSL